MKSRQAADRQQRITTGSLISAVVVMLGIIVSLAYPHVAEWNGQRLARGQLILIPEGLTAFGVKNNDSAAGTAVPSTQIFLPAFKIDTYEVTNGQYKLCVMYGNCTVPLEQADFQGSAKQDYPIVFVTLFQANNFCKWLGQRLPNEVEWERAARGPQGQPWPWGDKMPTPDFVNMPAQGTYEATKGLKPVNSNASSASSEGVYNLIGNAAEWTSSYLYTGGKYNVVYWDGKPDDFKGTALYATRGGGWANKIEYVSQITPDAGTDVREDIGFRCATDIKQ